MKNSDYIPKSARIKFGINVSKFLQKLSALADICASIGLILEETQEKLKIGVIETAELECANIKDSLFAHLPNNIHVIDWCYRHDGKAMADP